MNVAIRLVTGVVAVSLGIGTGVALASAPMVAKAKGMGMPAKNCQYCHTESAPKKDTFKPESLPFEPAAAAEPASAGTGGPSR